MRDVIPIGHPYIRATSLIGFDTYCAGFGVDGQEIIRQVGLPERTLRSPDMLISYRRMVAAIEKASRASGRPAFALEWAEAMPDHFPTLGPIALLAKFTRRLDEWIDASLEYWSYHTNGFTMRLLDDEKTGEVAFRYTGDPFEEDGRQIKELIFGCIFNAACRVTGHLEERPIEMRFRHPAPADLRPHGEVFKCPVVFDCDYDEIVFERRYLSFPTNGNFAILKSVVGLYMKSRIRAIPQSEHSLSYEVSLALATVLGSGRSSIGFIAEALGMSPKKLQRLLADEGTTFSEILDRVRHSSARRMLRGSRAPVARIAGLLDYSSTASFSLAFKRWTGMSPLNFRRGQVEGEDGGEPVAAGDRLQATGNS